MFDDGGHHLRPPSIILTSDLKTIRENAPASSNTDGALSYFSLLVSLDVENFQSIKPIEKVVLHLPSTRCVVCAPKRRANLLGKFVPVAYRSAKISNQQQK
jgi:hypothetical protein